MSKILIVSHQFLPHQSPRTTRWKMIYDELNNRGHEVMILTGTPQEEKNENITKVAIDWKEVDVVGNSLDFYKFSTKQSSNIYQHVGIYSFKPIALRKFVSLPPSKNEIDRKLEQLRAIDAGIKIGITYVENVPISVDTSEDLMLIENILKNRDENK